MDQRDQKVKEHPACRALVMIERGKVRGTTPLFEGKTVFLNYTF